MEIRLLSQWYRLKVIFSCMVYPRFTTFQLALMFQMTEFSPSMTVTKGFLTSVCDFDVRAYLVRPQQVLLVPICFSLAHPPQLSDDDAIRGSDGLL